MGGHLAVDPADRVRTRRTEWLSGRRLFLLPMNLKKPGCTALQRAFQRCLGGVMTSTLLAASREIPAVDIDLDGLSSSDVQLFQGSMSAGINAGDTWIRAEVNGGWFGVDYRPVDFDLFGSAVRIEEPRIGAGIRSSHAVGDRWTLLTDASAYDGFQSYRSAWVAQWYSQFFNGLPGLKEADPAGMAGGIGIRHELIRTRLWVQLEAGLALDRIAPGYTEILDENESLVDVRPLRSHLATQSYRLSLENAVTPWLKTRVAVRVADQVERRQRWSGTGEANIALGPDWVVRVDGGYAWETFNGSPERRFEGWWTGTGVEWEFREGWHWVARGRAYRDNGEIENSISFSTSAPALDSAELGMGLRWSKPGHTVFLSAGPYWSQYEPVTFNTAFFANLYRDRVFLALQASYRWEF